MNKFMSNNEKVLKSDLTSLHKKISTVASNSKNNSTIFIKNNTNTIVFDDTVNICFVDKYNNSIDIIQLPSGQYMYTDKSLIKVFINVNLNYLWINQKPPRFSFIIKQNDIIITDMVMGVSDYSNKVNTLSERVIVDAKQNDIFTIYLKKNIEHQSDYITINTNSFISFDKII